MTDESIMPFGKYKGQALKDVPDSVLLWYYDNKKLSGQLKDYVEDRIPVLRFQKEKRLKDGGVE